MLRPVLRQLGVSRRADRIGGRQHASPSAGAETEHDAARRSALASPDEVWSDAVRDDFPAGVKDELAKRVSYLCSNPRCRQPTSGPQSSPSGTVNIGVAAHITAAA